MNSKPVPNFARLQVLVVLIVCSLAPCVWILGPRAQAWYTHSPVASRALAAVEPGTNSSTLFEPATVHGWVKKRGVLNPVHWHDAFEQQRKAGFKAWVQTWTEQEELGQMLDPPPVLFPARCQISLNHQYKYVYLRHPKTGSTSLRAYLRPCNSTDGLDPPGCLTPLPHNTTREEVLRIFSHYLVFTVVRNPYARALSNYRFLLGLMRAGPRCTRGITWGGFCHDPMRLGMLCRRRSGCCVYSAEFAWHHLSSQARCLLAGEWEEGGAAGEVEGGPPPTQQQQVEEEEEDEEGGEYRGGEDDYAEEEGAAGEGQGSGGGRRRLRSEVGGGLGGSGEKDAFRGDGWAVDFIARTEALEEDLLQFFKRVDERRGSGLPALSTLLAQRGGPQQLNVVRTCAGEGEDGGQLQPKNTSALGGVYYMAAVPQEQYCSSEEYFQGQHLQCIQGVERFYQRDLELLYGVSTLAAEGLGARGPRAAGAEQQIQQA